MKHKKVKAIRGVRKTAHISRRIFSKAANLSAKVELKAGRIINGTDPVIQIYNKVLFEKIYAEALPEIIPIHPALPLPGRRATITLLLPSLQNSSFFGGTATALIFAAKLAQERQMPLRLVETVVHGNAQVDKLLTFLSNSGFKLQTDDISLVNLAGRKYDHYGYIDIHPKDVFVASAWWDAHLLNALPLQSKYIYLIQDFEPIFYNNSDQYILAEDTYRNTSFIPVFNTKLMMEFIQGRNYEGIPKNALFFEPAVNIGRKIGFCEPKKPGEKQRLLIYGRPSVQRNLFYRALEVVNKAFAENILDKNDWEIFMAGQDKLPNILLDCGMTVTNLGKLDFDKYYAFAKTTDIALSLMMAPHPSYPPLELSSLGSVVVTTSYENKKDLSNYSHNLIVCSKSINSLVNGIREASKISYADRLKNAKAVALETDWDKALDDTVSRVIKNV